MKKTYRIRIIGLKDRNSVVQTPVHEPFDKHAQRCASEVQLQISAFFFHYSCHHLAKFPCKLEEPSAFVWLKHSHPRDYKQLADESHHLTCS